MMVGTKNGKKDSDDDILMQMSRWGGRQSWAAVRNHSTSKISVGFVCLLQCLLTACSSTNKPHIPTQQMASKRLIQLVKLAHTTNKKCFNTFNCLQSRGSVSVCKTNTQQLNLLQLVLFCLKFFVSDMSGLENSQILQISDHLRLLSLFKKAHRVFDVRKDSQFINWKWVCNENLSVFVWFCSGRWTACVRKPFDSFRKDSGLSLLSQKIWNL
jgi:hypothetical protein